MSDNETQRIIGAIQAMSDNHSDQLTKIFERLNELQKNGCSLGQQHSKNIEELQQKPEKIIGILGGLVGIASAIGTVFMLIWNHGK